MMNRAIPGSGHHITVAVVYLCMLALIFCQVLGATARLSHDIGALTRTSPLLVTMGERTSRAQYPVPSRCASIKLAPVEIRTVDLRPSEGDGACLPASMSKPPRSAELGVPTPPPRQI